jgi:hypothetical protein
VGGRARECRYLEYRVRSANEGDFERGLAPRRVAYSLLNCHQVRAQLDRVKSHFIAAARDNVAELYGLNCCETDAERLSCVDALLADDKYLFPVAERDGGVKTTLRE